MSFTDLQPKRFRDAFKLHFSHYNLSLVFCHYMYTCLGANEGNLGSCLAILAWPVQRLTHITTKKGLLVIYSFKKCQKLPCFDLITFLLRLFPSIFFPEIRWKKVPFTVILRQQVKNSNMRPFYFQLTFLAATFNSLPMTALIKLLIDVWQLISSSEWLFFF